MSVSDAMIVVPAQFAEAIVGRKGRIGERWIRSLPELVARLARTWALQLGGEPMHGGLSLVVPVRWRDEECVLKLVPTAGEARIAATALDAWRGEGAAYLRAAAFESGAVLMERLQTDRSTAVLPTCESVRIAAGLLRRLAVPPPKGIPSQASIIARFRRDAELRWRRLHEPFPYQLLNRAIATAAENSESARLLVHYDLHDGNILASKREPWLAIDPKVVAGDPEIGVAQMLWRRLDDITGPAQFEALLGLICDVAELDMGKTRKWSTLRCVDYWLWGLEGGLTEDPVRCARMLEWLSGHDALS